MCNLFFCKKSNRCKEWYLMIIIGKWILYWKAFLCLSMIYYILLQTSTGIISLKNTTTNRHIESANLIYIALYVTFNPIRPDPFEFLIGLSVCLWDTHSLMTIWNELEGCNFSWRFDFTHFEDPSIQIWKVDSFRVGGRGYQSISKP